MLTLESFEEASEIVKKVTQETKLIKSSYFSDLTGNKVYLKPENMQRTGAVRKQNLFKISLGITEMALVLLLIKTVESLLRMVIS